MSKLKTTITSTIIISSLSLLAGCGNQPANQAPAAAQSHPKQLPQQYFAQQNQNQQHQAADEVRLHQISKSLAKSYHGLFTVHYQPKRNGIELTPINKDVKKIIKAADHHNKSAIKVWRKFVSGVKSTSKSVSKGAHDRHAQLIVMHPTKHTTLYKASNGHVTYNHY